MEIKLSPTVRFQVILPHVQGLLLIILILNQWHRLSLAIESRFVILNTSQST